MKRLHRALLMPWAGGNNSMAYTNKVIALGPIVYFPLADTSGATATDASGNGRNGAYTGVTLGAPGIGDGRTAASFDGATSYVDIYTAGLGGAFNGDEGTYSYWMKVSGSGVWTDGQRRYALRLFTNANNTTFSYKDPSQMVTRRIGGATSKLISFGTTTTAWLHIAMTWSVSGNQQIQYINGVAQGAPTTGLVAYNASGLDSSLTLIGASAKAPTEVWSGTIAHVAVWASALNATQIASLATV